MKYVLLGSLSPEWAVQHDKRVNSAKAKLDALSIKLIGNYYTQGQYDFVDVVDTPNAESLLAFSVWYVAQGYGRFQSLPAFDSAELAKAAGR